MYTNCILERQVSKHYRELCALYLLGDNLKDKIFCEKVIEALVVQKDGFVWPPLQPEVSYVWERTLPTSPLRSIIKEIWLTMSINLSIETLKENPEAPFPMDFVLDLFAMLVEKCQGATNSSFSGKRFDELRETCINFVRDAAMVEDN